MRAMILAAGRGQRMRELTNDTPKPLLKIAGQFIIEYAIENIKMAGIDEIVINLAYRGEQIQHALGNGKRYGVKIQYSIEDERLEVGGGILKALPLLGKDPFIVVSGDVITDYPLANLPVQPIDLAHLILVKNPAFHPQGDFGLRDNFYLDRQSKPTYTFANIGVYRPEIFSHCEPGYFAWNKVMFPLIDQGKVTGECYTGIWHNVGTPEDLAKLNSRAREDSNLRPLVSETNTLSN